MPCFNCLRAGAAGQAASRDDSHKRFLHLYHNSSSEGSAAVWTLNQTRQNHTRGDVRFILWSHTGFHDVHHSCVTKFNITGKSIKIKYIWSSRRCADVWKWTSLASWASSSARTPRASLWSPPPGCLWACQRFSPVDRRWALQPGNTGAELQVWRCSEPVVHASCQTCFNPSSFKHVKFTYPPPHHSTPILQHLR